MSKPGWLFLLFLAFLRLNVIGHDGLDLQPPIAAPEAWNTLTLCHANIQELAKAERWSEIGIQASLSIQAARFLREESGDNPEKETLRQKIRALEEAGLNLFNASQSRQPEPSRKALEEYGKLLQDVSTAYPSEVVHATVYSCPMCRGIRELNPKATCFKCGMRLEPRSIPASNAYTAPGEPAIAVTPIAKPLEVGKPADVTVRLNWKKDGEPVTLDQLRIVHTEPIHLLIIDQSLADYHHEHPRSTGVPGEYRFAFTPQRAGPYRIFADLDPAETKVQEYAMCDLPASTSVQPEIDHSETTAAVVDGLMFQLKWRNPVRAKEPVSGLVTITTQAGQPFTQLEPVMGTYAHIVGFYEDHQTVLHIHPSGGADPQSPSDRGGPRFHFTFYAPKPGFIRLYVQVQVNGTSRFAPFGLIVAQ